MAGLHDSLNSSEVTTELRAPSHSTDMKLSGTYQIPKVAKTVTNLATLVTNLTQKFVAKSTTNEHASEIYREVEAACGQQCLALYTIFRKCQRYEAEHQGFATPWAVGHSD